MDEARPPWFAALRDPPTFYANKRWGHGRTLQLLRRFRCIVRGHDIGEFREGVRHCSRGCGGMTTRGAGRCTDCGVWAGQMERGWFGNLAGWTIGKGFLLCPAHGDATSTTFERDDDHLAFDEEYGYGGAPR